MTDEEKANDIREAGDAFVTRAVILLVLIHLLIFPPLPKEQEDVNQFVGNEMRRVTDQRALLERDLAHVNRELRLGPILDADAAVAEEKGDKVLAEHLRHRKTIQFSLESDATYKFSSETESLLKTKNYLRLIVEKNAEQIVTLAKAKYVRELKIPGTESAVDESQVRVFYPIGLSITLLIVVFRYRNPVLQALKANSSTPPVWAAPLPYGKYNLKFWQCSVANALWLSVVAIVLRLFMSATLRREFFASRALYTTNLVAGCFCLATYTYLLAEAILTSKRGNRD